MSRHLTTFLNPPACAGGCLVTDLIEEYEHDYPVTLIRGIRNEKDLNYEMVQYQFMKDLKPTGLNMVSFFSDREFQHISSSAIRQLVKYNKHQQYMV